MRIDFDDLEIQEIAEGLPPEIKPDPGHPVCFDAGSKYPLVMLDGNRARLWVQLDDALRAEAVSDLSPLDEYQHSLAIWCDDCGLDDLVRGGAWGDDAAENWALAEGLIAFQPFQIEVYVYFYISHGPEGDEGDCDTEVDILKIEPVDAAKAAEFWEERFGILWI